ncbi:MAG: hypothetical protein ACSLE0_23295 [Chitinophagaceae bacterium]
MGLAFREDILVVEETNIELLKTIDKFIDRMDAHIEKFPNYKYGIEMLGGTPGQYKARIIIERYDNKEAEFAEGDSSSYGVL